MLRRILISALAAWGFAMTAASSDAADKPPGQGNLPVVELSAEELARRKIETIALGDLEVPTGRIVVADPLVNPERPALAREVPKGRYPVTLFKAQYRIAMAMVRFAPGKVARWEMATLPNQDPAELKGDEIFGYPVDAGTGCFMDASAHEAMNKRENIQIEKQRGTPDPYSNYYDDVVSREMEKNGGNYAMHRPLEDDPVNVAVFQSGWGDGFYASYWGLDEGGRPLVLVTDFGVVEGADGRSEYEKRHEAILAGMSPEQRETNHSAFKALDGDDAASLRAMLAAGRIGPADYLIESQESAVMTAIRRDKPEILELLIGYGAPLELTADDRSVAADRKTYPDFIRWLHAETRKDDMVAARRANGYGPISDALLDVANRWEAGKIALVSGASRRDKSP